MTEAKLLRKRKSPTTTVNDILRLMEQDDAIIVREYESGDIVCHGQVSDVPAEIKLWKARTIVAGSLEFHGWDARIEIEASGTKSTGKVSSFDRATRWVTRALQRARRLGTEIGGGR